MNRDTTLKEVQRSMGYPTADDVQLKVHNPFVKKIPLGEVNYEDLGGYKRYHLACRIYWKKRLGKMSYEKIAEIYDYPVQLVKQLCDDFQKEIDKPVYIYEEKISRN